MASNGGGAFSSVRVNWAAWTQRMVSQQDEDQRAAEAAEQGAGGGEGDGKVRRVVLAGPLLSYGQVCSAVNQSAPSNRNSVLSVDCRAQVELFLF